jgi:hypothetical protein
MHLACCMQAHQPARPGLVDGSAEDVGSEEDEEDEYDSGEGRMQAKGAAGVVRPNRLPGRKQHAGPHAPKPQAGRHKASAQHHGSNPQASAAAAGHGGDWNALALAGAASAHNPAATVNRGLAGLGEAACTGASVTLTVAAAAATHGRVPDSLISIVSPFKAQMEELRVLGKGGFGSVALVRSRLDHRLLAVKQVRFRSALPPWAPPDALEASHHKLLREVRGWALIIYYIMQLM